MAKISGTQSIPPEWLDEYRATLAEKLPDGGCRKRFPFHQKQFQKYGTKVTSKQLKQRGRFTDIITKFKGVPWETRQRWYAAMPQWHSVLWYFNYFMMSGLDGNALVGDKGGGVIKNIRHYSFTYPAGAPANVTVNIDSCDPKKTIAFIYGAGWYGISDAVAVPIYPFPAGIYSTYAVFKMSATIDVAVEGSASIIEYI